MDALEERALIRRKGSEIVERQSYEASDGYFCLSSADSELVINAIKACQDAAQVQIPPTVAALP